MKLSLPDLHGLPVMLSASLPQDLVGTSRAQELFDIIVAVVGGVLSANGTLVLGGHPSVTPLVHRVASSFNFKDPRMTLFQLRRFQGDVPKEAYDEQIFGKVIWVGGEPVYDTALRDELAEMRDGMVKMARAGIFLGGKVESNVGGIPGIRDEYQRFIDHHKEGPAYLLGGLGGEALRIIQSLEAAGGREPNGLSSEEIADVRYGDDIDFAASIVITDIRRHTASASEYSVAEVREERMAGEALTATFSTPEVLPETPDNLNWSDLPPVFIINFPKEEVELVSAVLRSQGFFVDAVSMVEAADKLRSFKPELLIVDLSVEYRELGDLLLHRVRDIFLGGDSCDRRLQRVQYCRTVQKAGNGYCF